MTDIKALAAFNDNYIWLLTSPAETWVVDPGDAAPVERALQSLERRLDGILLTHHHLDHVGGVAQLCRRYDPVVVGPTRCACAGITRRVAEGDAVRAAGLELQVMEIPGHTLDHIAYWTEHPEPLVFCGDTLFAGGCGRIFEGTPGMMYHSLTRLAQLPAQTRVYCAHEYTLANLAFARAVEPANAALEGRLESDGRRRASGLPTVPSTLALEAATNPFLRCTAPAVSAAAAARSAVAPASPEAVFTILRGWKDGF